MVMMTTLCHFFFIVFDLTFISNDFSEFYKKWLGTLVVLIPLDMLLKVNSGFFEEGSIIIDRKRIWKKYLRTDLPYDLLCFTSLIALLHFKFFNLMNGNVNFIQVLYFVKVPIFSQLLENFEEIINFDEKLEAFLALLKHFVKMLFFSHCTACIWFYMGYHTSEDDGTWLSEKGYTNKPIFFQYLVSLYWAITTISTTGYGDVTAQNEREFVFCMLVMILGSIFFGYSLTYIGVVFDKLNQDQQRKKYYFTKKAKFKRIYNL